MPLPNAENPAKEATPRPAVDNPHYVLPGTAVQPQIDPVTGQIVQAQLKAEKPQAQPELAVPPSGQ
jgi:hypothetical protein